LTSFYDRPILNSPYRAPELHHPLDDNGQPLEGEPRRGRRPSRFIVPVPAARKKAANDQASLELETFPEHQRLSPRSAVGETSRPTRLGPPAGDYLLLHQV